MAAPFPNEIAALALFPNEIATTDWTGRPIVKPDELTITKFIFEQISHHAKKNTKACMLISRR